MNHFSLLIIISQFCTTFVVIYFYSGVCLVASVLMFFGILFMIWMLFREYFLIFFLFIRCCCLSNNLALCFRFYKLNGNRSFNWLFAVLDFQFWRIANAHSASASMSVVLMVIICSCCVAATANVCTSHHIWMGWCLFVVSALLS